MAPLKELTMKIMILRRRGREKVVAILGIIALPVMFWYCLSESRVFSYSWSIFVYTYKRRSVEYRKRTVQVLFPARVQCYAVASTIFFVLEARSTTTRKARHDFSVWFVPTKLFTSPASVACALY